MKSLMLYYIHVHTKDKMTNLKGGYMYIVFKYGHTLSKPERVLVGFATIF